MRNPISFFAALLIMAATILSSCASSDSGTNNGNNNGSGGTVPTTPNTMNATADGTAYTFICAGVKQTSSGNTIVSVAGADTSGRGMGFSLTNISGTGTYDVGLASYSGGTLKLVTMVYSYTDASQNDIQYSTPPTGTTSVGKITITEFTATSFKATFYATLDKLSGATGASTAVITKGGVNSTIQ